MDIVEAASREQETHYRAAFANQQRREREDPLYLDGIRCCLGCKKPIPEGRLESMPTAVRCVPCQDRHEKGTP